MRPLYTRAQLQRQTGEIVRQIVKGTAETKSYFIKDCLRTPHRPDTNLTVPADLYVNAEPTGTHALAITKPHQTVPSDGNLNVTQAWVKNLAEGSIDAKQLLCFNPFDFLMNKPRNSHKYIGAQDYQAKHDEYAQMNKWELVNEAELSDIPARQGINGIEGAACNVTSMVFSGILRGHRLNDGFTYSHYAGIKPVKYRFVLFETKEPLVWRTHKPPEYSYATGSQVTVSPRGAVPKYLEEWLGADLAASSSFAIEKGQKINTCLGQGTQPHYVAKSVDGYQSLGPFEYRGVRNSVPMDSIMKHNSKLSDETTWIRDDWNRSPDSNLKRVIKDITITVYNGKAGIEVECDVQEMGETRNRIMARPMLAGYAKPGEVGGVPGGGDHDFVADPGGTGPDGQWDPEAQNQDIKNVGYETGYTKNTTSFYTKPVFNGQKQFKIVVTAKDLGLDHVGSKVDFHSTTDEFLPGNCKRNIYYAMCCDEGIPAREEKEGKLVAPANGLRTPRQFVKSPGYDSTFVHTGGPVQTVTVDGVETSMKTAAQWNHDHVEMDCMIWFKDF